MPGRAGDEWQSGHDSGKDVAPSADPAAAREDREGEDVRDNVSDVASAEAAYQVSGSANSTVRRRNDVDATMEGPTPLDGESEAEALFLWPGQKMAVREILREFARGDSETSSRLRIELGMI